MVDQLVGCITMPSGSAKPVKRTSVSASADSGLVPPSSTPAALFVNVVSSMYRTEGYVVVDCGIRSATIGRRWADSTSRCGIMLYGAQPAASVIVVLRDTPSTSTAK